MIYAQPGATFEAGVQNFPSGLEGTIGVRILDTPSNTVITARTTSGIQEEPSGSGYYTVSLTAPVVAGTYSVFWDYGSVTPSTTAAEELVVTASSPAIAASPSGSDLTTLAAVRAFLQKPASDTNQDAVINSLITRASIAIMGFTEREFAPATTAATRSFEYDNSGWLDLAPYDLRSVTSVQIDTENTSSTVSSTYYRLWPFPAKDGVYTHLRLNPWTATGNAGSYFAQRRVAITGNWGFASVPSDVEHACLVTVATWLRKDVAAFSTVFRIDEGLLERPEALPSEAAQILWRYKRTGYA